MADLPPFPGPRDDRDSQESRGRKAGGVPGWLIFVAVAVLIVVAVVVMHETGIMPRGLHGGAGHGG